MGLKAAQWLRRNPVRAASGGKSVLTAVWPLVSRWLQLMDSQRALMMMKNRCALYVRDLCHLFETYSSNIQTNSGSCCELNKRVPALNQDVVHSFLPRRQLLIPLNRRERLIEPYSPKLLAAANAIHSKALRDGIIVVGPTLRRLHIVVHHLDASIRGRVDHRNAEVACDGAFPTHKIHTHTTYIHKIQQHHSISSICMYLPVCVTGMRSEQ